MEAFTKCKNGLNIINASQFDSLGLLDLEYLLLRVACVTVLTSNIYSNNWDIFKSANLKGSQIYQTNNIDFNAFQPYN